MGHTPLRRLLRFMAAPAGDWWHYQDAPGNKGRELYRANERVKQVHPYDRKWGGLLKPEYRANVFN